MTVLFADLAGFTSRSEGQDIEDVQALLDRYHLLSRHEIERHGGTIAKFIGDGVMALFGAPVAHEDDSERAVRGALAIQAAVGEQRSEDPAFDVHVRVGIATGEVLVTTLGQSVDAVGDVVNTAARLESAAPRDGVLVADAAYRVTTDTVEYSSEATPITAKGKSEPVTAWIALRARPVVDDAEPLQGPLLVGREAEMEKLWSRFEQSRASRTSQFIILTGVPGIGKTRLVSELRARMDTLREPVTWRQGRSPPYGEGVAFSALGQMVKIQAGILETTPGKEASERLHSAVVALFADRNDADWVERQLAPLVGIEQPRSSPTDARPTEAFAAWRLFFERLASVGPLVLVFEDLHWADDALLDFIESLRTESTPLLIIATARPELMDRRPVWRQTPGTAVELLALTEAETTRLVSSLLEAGDLSEEVGGELVARAQGNPLFAREYVRMLIDGGLLVRSDNGWLLCDGTLPLPQTLHAIVGARLDALPPDEETVIEDASVVGEIVWGGAVAAIGDLESDSPSTHLASLVHKQFLVRQPESSVEGEREFTFSHGLIRDVAYQRLPRARRAQSHLHMARWIETLGIRFDGWEPAGLPLLDSARPPSPKRR